MRVMLDSRSIDDYAKFLAIKSMPKYRIAGDFAEFPDEYAHMIGATAPSRTCDTPYEPIAGLFDYQRAIVEMAVRKRKFCVFADCGLGKTLIQLEFARHVVRATPSGSVLIIAPLMVVRQTAEEHAKFYGEPLRVVRAAELNSWLANPDSRLAITNYDALKGEETNSNLIGLILDESSMLKSHYGKWGQACIDLGKGVPWKMALSGTPAPNDRVEYANHALFMDSVPTVNSFLAKYFVNRGQTANRWEIKPHSLGNFYRDISHWGIFLTDPSVYGWRDNCSTIPPMHVHIHDIPLTDRQRELVQNHTGQLIAAEPGGIGDRSVFARLSKGTFKGEIVESLKPKFVVDLANSWPDESTIVWCVNNDEQELLSSMMPGAANIDGSTPIEERERLIASFKAGTHRVMISKPKILGFGLNLQICTRQIFSGLQDSYEQYYQAVKRSNRYGSTKPLTVHIPITELERPMIQTVLDKAHRVDADTKEQERIFKENACF